MVIWCLALCWLQVKCWRSMTSIYVSRWSLLTSADLEYFQLSRSRRGWSYGMFEMMPATWHCRWYNQLLKSMNSWWPWRCAVQAWHDWSRQTLVQCQSQLPCISRGIYFEVMDTTCRGHSEATFAQSSMKTVVTCPPWLRAIRNQPHSRPVSTLHHWDQTIHFDLVVQRSTCSNDRQSTMRSQENLTSKVTIRNEAQIL